MRWCKSLPTAISFMRKRKPKAKSLKTVNAIYVPEDKTLYISDQLDINDPKNDVTFVHEMVHYVQDISGYTRSLNGHLACTESEAYDVQILWDKIHNGADADPYAYQQSLIAATRCMGSKTSAFGKMQQAKMD